MNLVEILRQILVFLYNLIGSYGWAIVALALVVFIMMLPLFWIAEKIQNKERKRKAKMQSLLDEISDVQNKQERYYYTKEVYKRFDYKPYYSLVGLIGLVIQIPFFLAAYWMLSEFKLFEGESFGPISNLYKADGLLNLGAIQVNVLPFLMTVVNFVAIYFVRDRLEKREIKQLVITAFIFLILLYNMPSALVLYWTANNVFSIFKNKLIRNENVVSSVDHDLSLESLKVQLERYYPQIATITGVLIGYFYLVHIILNGLIGLETSTKTFLSLGLMALTTLYFLKMYLYKSPSKIVVLVFSSLSICLVLLTPIGFRESLGLDLSAEAVCIAKHLLFWMAVVMLSLKKASIKGRTLKGVNSEVPLKKKYLLFVAWSVPLSVYLINNLEYFSLFSSVLYYLMLIGIPILITQLLGWIYRRSIDERIYLPTVAAVILTLFSVPFITNYFQADSVNNYALHVLLMIGFVILILFVNNRDKKIIPFLTFSLLIVLISRNFYQNFGRFGKEKMHAAEQFFSDKEIKRTPDIYLMIYDAYVEEEQMKRLYKIDNSEQMQFLRSHGFEFHENVYSTGRASLESMANVLNLSSDFVPYGPDGQYPDETKYRELLSGSSLLNRKLRENNYRMHNVVNPYMVRGVKPTVDFTFPEPEGDGMMIVVQSILMGEFKFDIEYEDPTRWKIIKDEIILRKNVQPTFLYTHNLNPGHSQNSGTLLPNEIELFERRLRDANEAMKKDVENILKKNKDAIIIVAGDHGPYLTGNGIDLSQFETSEITSDQILDRFGVFLAVRYPEGWSNRYDKEIKVLQDIFVNVLSNMCEVNAPDNLVDRTSNCVNHKINAPAIVDGIINIGKNKGEPLYR